MIIKCQWQQPVVTLKQSNVCGVKGHSQVRKITETLIFKEAVERN